MTGATRDQHGRVRPTRSGEERRRRPGTHALATALAAVLLGGGLLASCADDNGAKPDKETFCAKVAEFNTGTQAFDLNVADDADVERVAQLLDEIEASAPEEIRADVEARFAYVDDVIAASRGDEEAVARLGEADPSATDEAQTRIDAYAQEECGLSLEPAGTTATSTTGVVPPPSVATTAPPVTDTVPSETVPSDTVPSDTVAPESAPATTAAQGA